MVPTFGGDGPETRVRDTGIILVRYRAVLLGCVSAFLCWKIPALLCHSGCQADYTGSSMPGIETLIDT